MCKELNDKKPSIAVWIAFLAALLCCGTSAPAALQQVKLTATQQKKIDTFFTNFSEVNLLEFKRGHVTDRMLISFGVMHEAINSHATKVSAQRVERLALWYFGVSVRHHGSVPGGVFQRIDYHNGYYNAPPEDEANSSTAHVAHLWSPGSGYFKAEVILEYQMCGDATISNCKANYTALIRQVGSGAPRRYVLLEYQEKK